MKVLVLGASGATGRLVVQQLLNRGINTKIVIRNSHSLSDNILSSNNVECIIGSIAEFNPDMYVQLISDCDAVVSCLGHNITFSGMFGKPRDLVTRCIKNICEAAASKKKKLKLILMNTTANRNMKVKENYTAADKTVLFLMRALPPHEDNIKAAKYLSNDLGENSSYIEWIAVRPDTLINDENVTTYKLSESPIQSPVFNAGKTSRINVSRFMIELLCDNECWNKWKFKMPVIYNA